MAKTKEIKKVSFATDPIGKLIVRFAIPCVIALVVNALYNIVGQIFIGWGGRISRQRCNEYRIPDHHCCIGICGSGRGRRGGIPEPSSGKAIRRASKRDSGMRSSW